MTSSTYYIQFIGSSLLIIGVLLIILKLSKKHTIARGKDIKLIDRFAMGSQSNIFIFEIREKTYVIGATNQHISVIDKL